VPDKGIRSANNIPPHPGPLPKEREGVWRAARQSGWAEKIALPLFCLYNIESAKGLKVQSHSGQPNARFPLPRGEGQGEGEFFTGSEASV